MTTYTQWRQGNTTKYLQVASESTTDFSIDFESQLATGDTLATATATATGIVFDNVNVYADTTLGNTTPHMVTGFITVASAGTYAVKLTVTTSQGKTFVYHFDVFAEQ